MSKTRNQAMNYTEPVAFGCGHKSGLDLPGVSSDDGVPVIKDRILYWPTLLAIVCCLLSLMGAAKPLEGEVGPGPLVTFALPLLIAAIARR
jgi:hypothetical protein